MPLFFQLSFSFSKVMSERFILILITRVGWWMDGQSRRQLDGTETWQTERHAATKSKLVYFLQRCFIFNSKAWHMFELYLLSSTLATQQQRRQRQNVKPCIHRKLCGPKKQVRSPPSQCLLMSSLPLSLSLVPFSPPALLSRSVNTDKLSQPPLSPCISWVLLAAKSPTHLPES